MSKVTKIESNNSFKTDNLSNWKEVSDFWLTGNLSQKKDLVDFYKKKLGAFFQTKELKILDVGCGDGWVLDVIESLENAKFSYLGIDYNEAFVEYLNANKKSDKASFKYIDIEDINVVNKLGTFDLIINSFSLFEMPSYDLALNNQAKLLNEQGSILVFSIDPTTQIMAISDSEEEFKENCIQYANYKNYGYYRKLIDTGEGFANQEYLGILHSLSDYLKILRFHDFSIVDLDEINLLQDVVPKIYQYVQFKRT
jgi:2-polyprenyl-3-methyl-5-hydroxy-6-metoxy-1,4-benzoquinol methylase